MTNTITEVRIKPTQNALRLEFGLPVADDGGWRYARERLEVRLYCDPFPDLGKPSLLSSGLADRQQTKGRGYVIPFAFLELGENWEETTAAFQPGMQFASMDGRCYPLYFNLKGTIPEVGSAVNYVVVEWSVSDPDWLNIEHTFYVDFGVTEGDKFVRDRRFGPVEARWDVAPAEVATATTTHIGDVNGVVVNVGGQVYFYGDVTIQTGQQAPSAPTAEPEPLPVLPDVEIPDAGRVRGRGAVPSLMISYARRDMHAFRVPEIAQRLNQQHYYDVWIDYESIPGGARWREEISRGIQGADRVLFMMTPASIRSAYCKAELEHARKHNVPVIPLRLSDNTDLDALGLEGFDNSINWIDFTKGDPEEAWAKLLEELPTPPTGRRDTDLLTDPAFADLHRRYLRSIFTRLGDVHIPNFSRERVGLMDVYVPLKLGVSFNIDVESREITEWWMRDHTEPKQSEPPDGAERDKPKVLNGFAPGQGSAWSSWYAHMQAEWERYKQAHDQEQAEKSEEQREPIKDATYYWKRIESETAPALMPHLVITGDPGSGKSTLAKHMALCMAGDMLGHEVATLEAFTFWPHPAFTPVFIELRSLVRTAFPNTGDPVTLGAVYDYITETHLAPYDLRDYIEPLKRQMSNGEVIFYLDGLDEVPDAEQDARREQIKTLARELRGAFPDCHIVVTSRPYAYQDWSLDDFGQVTLATLDSDRLEELALRLFRVVLGQEGAEQEAETFQTQMKRVPDELRSTPLFFSLMAAIWLDNHTAPPEKRLPLTRGAIYRACVDMLVRRWTEKDLSGASLIERIGINERQLRDVLELLAYRVHKGTRGDDDAVFEGGEIFNVVMELRLGRIDPFELLDALSQRAGVMYAKAPNRFQFAHRSFQEHLAACYLSRPERFPDGIVTHVSEGAELWTNVLELLPEEVETTRLWGLIKALLPDHKAPLPDDRDNPVWSRIAFAARLMHIYRQPDDEDLREIWQRRLVKMLVKLVTLGALSPVPRAEAGRILGEWGDPRPGVGLDENGLPDIDWVPIPAGEFIYQDGEKRTLPDFKISRYSVTYRQFQAFVDDPEGFRDPRWWKGLKVPDEEREKPHPQAFPHWNHPRDNVSWYDAIAFCRWLSWKLGGGYALDDVASWAVRLPTEFEWERAARGTDGREYPYEGAFDASKGNTNETGIGQTSAVGIFPNGASPEGALDMSGNVWEWCLNLYNDPDSRDLNADGRRGLRGGSWGHDLHSARAFSRLNYSPYSRYYNSGFRVVCLLSSPKQL